MTTTSLARNHSAISETLAAALMLVIGMGFGRFAYTGMYPLMVRDGLLSVSAGSIAASANYAGYLTGALLLSRSPASQSASLAKIALVGTVACLSLLAIHLSPSVIAIVRFVAGVLSAMAMIAASTWLLQIVGNASGAPLLYAGVGIGIVLSAELIAAANIAALHSHWLWLLLAIAAGALAIPTSRIVSSFHSQSKSRPSTYAVPSLPDGELLRPWSLIVMYGLAGFGYIITATYLPLLVRNAVGQLDPIHIWTAFGLGAAPSCFLWHYLHIGLGTRRALALNLIAQACGVILPVASQSALAFMMSAILVGGTFMGTVTIAMPAARRVAAAVRFNIFATMTAAYGVGQIVGPLLSDTLYKKTQSFDLPLYAAGCALFAAAVVSLIRKHAN